MADRLISIDTAQPSTTQLPVDVRAELDALWASVRDALLVHKAGDETVTGIKSFVADLLTRNVIVTNNPAASTRVVLNNTDAPQSFEVGVNVGGQWYVRNTTTGVQPFMVSSDAPGGALELLAAAALFGVDVDLGGQDLLNVGNVNVANGLLQLDANARVPAAQLTVDVMQWKGTWNAATNTPTLADGAGSPGDTFRVTVAGTRNLGSGSQTFEVGDWLILSEALVWQKADMTDAVSSVAGLTGTITAANLRTALSLVVGTDVQAYAARLQSFSTMLAALSGSLTRVLTYVPDTDTWSSITTTAFGRSLLGVSDSVSLNSQLPTAINAQTGTNYDLNVTDAQKLVTMDNAAANTVTVPLNATQPFAVGTTINLAQLGAGQTSVVATGGLTLLSDNSKTKLAARYAGATLTKLATDTWWLAGALTA